MRKATLLAKWAPVTFKAERSARFLVIILFQFDVQHRRFLRVVFARQPTFGFQFFDLLRGYVSPRFRFGVLCYFLPLLVGFFVLLSLTFRFSFEKEVVRIWFETVLA